MSIARLHTSAGGSGRLLRDEWWRGRWGNRRPSGYANQYTKPFNEISGVITELQNAIACANRVFELLEQPSESPEVRMLCLLKLLTERWNLAMWTSYVKDQPLIEDFSA